MVQNPKLTWPSFNHAWFFCWLNAWNRNNSTNEEKSRSFSALSLLLLHERYCKIELVKFLPSPERVKTGSCMYMMAGLRVPLGIGFTTASPLTLSILRYRRVGPHWSTLFLELKSALCIQRKNVFHIISINHRNIPFVCFTQNQIHFDLSVRF